MRRLRFALIVAAVGLAAWVGYRDTIVGPLVRPIEVLTARLTAALVHTLGMEAVRAGTVVYHPDGFAFQISRGCTGLVPLALLAAGILAYPAARRMKVWGLLAGAPLLIALNLLRLVQLFIAGVRWPRSFDVAHEVVWQVVVALSVLGIWLAWVRWVDRNPASHRGYGDRVLATRIE